MTAHLDDTMIGLPGDEALQILGLAAGQPRPRTSGLRFPDGGAFRVEIPSVEGPDAMAAVLDEAARLGVLIHRISQGSGVMLLDDEEIRRMVRLGEESQVEVCLFLGPRASWDTGAARGTRNGDQRARVRGRDQLGAAIADAHRATEIGVRCLLVADEGLIWALHRQRGRTLPDDLTIKVSVLAGPCNPMAFRVLERLGADSINIPSDLSIAHVAEMRAAGDAAIDFYVEAPDDIGGFVRHYDAPELVRVGAPIYLKFGLRNAPDIYPSGGHLASAVMTTARERVRRAHLGISLLRRFDPDVGASPAGATRIGPLTRFDEVTGGRP
jgi:hypothetical protein